MPRLFGKYQSWKALFFEVVAEARSSEAFVALCLLTVAGTSLLTQKLGFSDTLGAFLGVALLAETNFWTQIEAVIRPFRGLLIGLFFVTTGTSIDTQLLFREWPNVLSLLAGLIAIKTLIITAIDPLVGLTIQESVLANFLSTPLASGLDGDALGMHYVAFDLDPSIVKDSFFVSFALGWVITNGAGLASYPIDTIRRRMMMTFGEAVKYKSSFDAFSEILKNEGPKSNSGEAFIEH